MNEFDHDGIPDARDGLKRKERIILNCLRDAQQESGGRGVSTIVLYGRVAEHLDISQEEFRNILSGMVGLTHLSRRDHTRLTTRLVWRQREPGGNR